MQTGNPLAMQMVLRQGGRTIDVADLPGEEGSARPTIRQPSRRLLVTVHGSCMNDRQWRQNGHDHAEALASAGRFTRVDVLYNSGRHIGENGRDLARLLEQLVSFWPVPVESITVLAHSMGGLVIRSACHAAEQAGHGWRDRLGDIVFLGTPHHGAPLERGGNVFGLALGWHRYSAPLARLARIRSAGVTDLRYGHLLEDSATGGDRFQHTGDRRAPVPLPSGVRCFAVAGTVASGGLKDGVGDGLVPVDSALGRHPDPSHTLDLPDSRIRVVDGVGHLDLLSSPVVFESLERWLLPGSPTMG